jgi:predicted RNase H-like HicB family nuclease
MEASRGTLYRVAVHRVRGGYFARVVDIPGCVARGASEVEAVENVRAAIRAFACVADVLARDKACVQVEIRA